MIRCMPLLVVLIWALAEQSCGETHSAPELLVQKLASAAKNATGQAGQDARQPHEKTSGEHYIILEGEPPKSMQDMFDRFHKQIFGPQEDPARLRALPLQPKFAVPELNPAQTGGKLIFNESEPTLVLFYLSIDRRSEHLLNVWDRVAQKLGAISMSSKMQLSVDQGTVKVEKLDSHRYPKIALDNGVDSFPTIRLFKQGMGLQYDKLADRAWQPNPIVNWVRQSLGRVPTLQSPAALDHFLYDNPLAVIGLFPDEKDYSKRGPLAAVFPQFDTVAFAEAHGPDVASQVAARLAHHLSRQCIIVTVGRSHGARAIQDLKDKIVGQSTASSSLHWECSPKPVNPQGSSWDDRFDTAVTGGVLVVKRVDKEEGWAQHLQLKCCNEQTGTTREIKIQVPSITILQPNEPGFAMYNGNTTDVHELEAWVRTRSLPMVYKFEPETFDEIIDQKGQMPMLFLFANQSPDSERFKLVMQKAAPRVHGTIILTWLHRSCLS